MSAANKITQHIPLTNPIGLAVLDACNGDSCDHVYISRINVPRAHRRKGYGRALLYAACQIADLLNVTLILNDHRYADCPMTDEELRAWYMRNGFEPYAGELVRRPQN